VHDLNRPRLLALSRGPDDTPGRDENTVPVELVGGQSCDDDGPRLVSLLLLREFDVGP